MTTLPLEPLSVPERPTISVCQRAGRTNGFSVMAPVAEEGHWVPGKEPLIPPP